jgi:gluconolactonase
LLLKKMASPKVTVVSPHPHILGEGPVWDERNNNLVYVDIVGHEVVRLNTVTGIYSKMNLGAVVGFAIPTTKSAHKMVVGSKKRLQMIDFADLSVTDLAEEVEKDLTGNNRFNDAKCDALGRLWAGTMGNEKVIGKEFQQEKSALYSLDADLTLRKQVEKVTISNGTIWSRDNKTMFYIDSPRQSVDAFDFDLQQGKLSNRRTVLNFNSGPLASKFKGFPDGMTIDADGKLWVAFFDGANVTRFDPETAKILQTVKIPASKTTSMCFGGPGYQDMYVTSAQFGLTEEDIKNEPGAGHTFKVTGLGIRGVPDYMFSG